MRAEGGSLLAFLPGAAEIRRTRALLQQALQDNRIDPTTDVVALYGALGADEQARAIEPAPPGRRKIVLATSIAETSITIAGVRMVVDSGLVRVPPYEPDVGVTRLDTVRVSRAAADQRRGRAGRTEPGLCYRLWDEPQTAALEPFVRPEILAADLSSFALDLAAWGADANKLAFLDPPPRAALAEARALLAALGAIDDAGHLTEEGRQLRRLPLPPRLARMVIDAARLGRGALAAEIAVLMGERGLGGDDIDMRERLAALRRDRSPRGRDAGRFALRGRKSQRLGAIVLAEQPVPVAPSEQSARLLAESIAKLGIDRLPWTKPLKQWRDRVMFLRQSEGAAPAEQTCEQTWPDLADTALAARAGEWLAPALTGKTA